MIVERSRILNKISKRKKKKEFTFFYVSPLAVKIRDWKFKWYPWHCCEHIRTLTPHAWVPAHSYNTSLEHGAYFSFFSFTCLGTTRFQGATELEIFKHQLWGHGFRSQSSLKHGIVARIGEVLSYQVLKLHKAHSLISAN